jgi:hypothetical protein
MCHVPKTRFALRTRSDKFELSATRTDTRWSILRVVHSFTQVLSSLLRRSADSYWRQSGGHCDSHSDTCAGNYLTDSLVRRTVCTCRPVGPRSWRGRHKKWMTPGVKNSSMNERYAARCFFVSAQPCARPQADTTNQLQFTLRFSFATWYLFQKLYFLSLE